MAAKVFSGGEALTAKLQELAEMANKSALVRVGFLEGATYDPSGTPVAMVAAVQEFGAPAIGIPPRPFFRGMIARESPHWGDDLGKMLKASGFDAIKALGLMGEEIQAQLVHSIETLTEPPLAEATAKAKGFDKPLIDTDHMKKSVNFEVKE